MISYPSAVEALYALGHELHPPRKFDLAHIRLLLHAIGDPQLRFPSVLIAGTNGKGSTAATLASILQASGHRTGLYTSPHLVRINERISLDGHPIPDDAFAQAYDHVSAAADALISRGELPHHPSFFETMTAIAFHFFAASQAEIAILEVGMGGRLDATNVVEPILSVITDIDLDHQKFLGDTIADIAREKAGILRPGVPAITLPQYPEANRVLGERMIELGCRAVSAARNVPATSPGAPAFVHPSAGEASALETHFPLSVLGQEIEIVSPLIGRHQLRNLALAITAAEELAALGFRTTPESIARGTRQTVWPGRLQRLAAGPRHPELLIDVAHNPAGAWALRSALSEHFEERPVVLLFGAMADKAIDDMAAILWPLASHLVLTRISGNPRAAHPQQLAQLAQSLGIPHTLSESVAQGLQIAIAQARSLGPQALVVLAGSIYLAGEALPLL
jgi:dihydrofolate synthase/folylpolyglutamate synthase